MARLTGSNWIWAVTLAAASADVDRATPLDVVTGRHNEIDTLKLLTADLERRVQRLAKPAFVAGASRADSGY